MTTLHLFPTYVANLNNGKPSMVNENIVATTDLSRVKLTLSANGIPSLSEDNDYILHVYMLHVPCTVPLERAIVKGTECYNVPNVTQVKYLYMGRYRFVKQSNGKMLATKYQGDNHEAI